MRTCVCVCAYVSLCECVWGCCIHVCAQSTTPVSLSWSADSSVATRLCDQLCREAVHLKTAFVMATAGTRNSRALQMVFFQMVFTASLRDRWMQIINKGLLKTRRALMDMHEFKFMLKFCLCCCGYGKPPSVLLKHPKYFPIVEQLRLTTERWSQITSALSLGLKDERQVGDNRRMEIDSVFRCSQTRCDASFSWILLLRPLMTTRCTLGQAHTWSISFRCGS